MPAVTVRRLAAIIGGRRIRRYVAALALSLLSWSPNSLHADEIRLKAKGMQMI
jgi:hypothetical protein